MIVTVIKATQADAIEKNIRPSTLDGNRVFGFPISDDEIPAVIVLGDSIVAPAER
ncbi:hypothetical protein [Silvibacterium acidisoli]|uniref:hypothetical protein n=1 Tax=Acidobacteriaceae bacterium ZG23-2 TaxID=2883246 RepID=UPI00406C8FBD